MINSNELPYISSRLKDINMSDNISVGECKQAESMKKKIVMETRAQNNSTIEDYQVNNLKHEITRGR